MSQNVYFGFEINLKSSWKCPDYNDDKWDYRILLNRKNNQVKCDDEHKIEMVTLENSNKKPNSTVLIVTCMICCPVFFTKFKFGKLFPLANSSATYEHVQSHYWFDLT